MGLLAYSDVRVVLFVEVALLDEEEVVLFVLLDDDVEVDFAESLEVALGDELAWPWSCCHFARICEKSTV